MTTQITIEGREYTVTQTEPAGDGTLESPYLLTPVKPRGQQKNFRLVRNQPRPQMMFPIGDKPMSPGGMPKWWVKEIEPGTIVPL